MVRKIEESVQEMLVVVLVVIVDVIENLLFIDLFDILKLMVGFSFDNEFGCDLNCLVICGQVNIFGVLGVFYFIDGVWILGVIIDYDLNDVEWIEVVKGLQSVFYG